jgi:hypothetical protein
MDEQTANVIPVAIQECKVIFHDMEGVDHSVIIHAETALQAAALGFKRILEQSFVESDFIDVHCEASGEWSCVPVQVRR